MLRTTLLFFQATFGYAATVAWLNSTFEFSTFSANNSSSFTGNNGYNVQFNCPEDKWCGMIVSDSLEPEIFTDGDTYVLARHSLCDWECCTTLKDNPPPDYSCPHPKCCNPHHSPVGLRAFPSVMGTNWSGPKNGGQGITDGLRGPTCARNALTDADFRPVQAVGGRLGINMTFPFGIAPNRSGFFTMDGARRAFTFIQAVEGLAASFDGGITTLDVGYHGKGAFTTCVVSEQSLCGCGWPLTNTLAQKCVPLNSDLSVYGHPDEFTSVLVHGALMSIAWGFCFPIGATSPRFWVFLKRALCGGECWFQVHRGCQLLGSGLTLVGFVIIVAATPEGKHFAGRSHKVVGLVLCLALLVQLVLGALRPHKKIQDKGKDNRRAVWKLGHTVLGYLLLLLGLFQLFSGTMRSAKMFGTNHPIHSLLWLWGGGLCMVFLLTVGVVVHRRRQPLPQRQISPGDGHHEEAAGKVEMAVELQSVEL